ncbi:single-stranded DNA-binding protein [Streptomyces albidoflavus]|uniref:Single-stranded DNA-binding protein n=1 Tax=Streptomyces odorifer TaxID=53450 RepID=A0A7Y6CBD9_9ACTN|nr:MULTISPECIES: single-stranded DNA-binding protein [Streptomyces]MBV1953175.1 single-stranded DNA-binding protein [Streptomyces sp. BV333]MCK2143509.1 single-stranded DNA-binding protein [Streptomyces sp. WAC00276]MCQ9710002.1 single-stranded DNA-binding protein [Streptomyces sp. BSP1]MCR0986416.1 single-stranded DNA-binding protein [Streptomyces albidoflavus]NUV29694.1 single-stranded DNA-binding protein [Streptomyces odorifer]
MNETMVTVVGNVATTPVYRESAHGPMARFRMAATPRRWDRERQSWTDGPTSFFTIWTTRQLASNVTASVTVGEPVIVQGRLRVRETERGGQQWTTAEIDAASVGHDLTRGTAAFRRVRKPVGTWPGGTATEDSRSAAAAQRAAGEPDWSVSGVGAGGEWGAGGEGGGAGGEKAEGGEGAEVVDGEPEGEAETEGVSPGRGES